MKFKKSRIKQIILEEYNKLNEGDFDPMGQDPDIDALLRKLRPSQEEKAEADRKAKELKEKGEQFIFGLYKVADEFKKTALEQLKGDPEAEKKAEAERQKLLQDFLDGIEAIERGEEINLEGPI